MLKKVQILGDGATARLAALGLSDAGCEVHLCAPPSSPSPPRRNDMRASAQILALNLATCASLDQLNVRPQGRPVEAIGVYAADETPHIWMPGFVVKAGDVDSAHLGRIVWQKDLLAALDEGLRARKIEIHEEEIKADLTICADRSHFYKASDYGQTALTGLVKHRWSHQNMAVQFFFSDGPLALLPVDDDHSVFIWTRPDETARALCDLEKKKFLLFLRQYLPADKQEVELAGEVEAHRLKFFFSSDWVQKDKLLIGEAAHQIHPLAGQGWNICVEDVSLLAEMAREAMFLGLPVFSSSQLEDYQRRRRAHGGALARSVDLLARFPLLSGTLPAALFDVLALSKPARRFFAHAGAGKLSSLRASSTKRIGMPSRTG